MSRKRLCRIVTKKFLSLFHLLPRYKVVAGGGWGYRTFGSGFGWQNFFEPGSSLDLCSTHSQYSLFISSTEHWLEKIVGHKADEEQSTKLFPMQKLIDHTAWVLQSNKILRERVDQAIEDCSGESKSIAQVRFSSTLDETSCCLVTAPSWKSVRYEKWNKLMK